MNPVFISPTPTWPFCFEKTKMHFWFLRDFISSSLQPLSHYPFRGLLIKMLAGIWRKPKSREIKQGLLYVGEPPPHSHLTTFRALERRRGGVRSSNLYNLFLLSLFLLPSTLHANSFFASTSLPVPSSWSLRTRTATNKMQCGKYHSESTSLGHLSPSGPALWVDNFCSHTGPHVLKGLELGFICCFAILKFLIFEKGALHSYCSEPCKLYSQPWPHLPPRALLLRLSLGSSLSLKQVPMPQHAALFSLVPPLQSLVLGLVRSLNWLQNDA